MIKDLCFEIIERCPNNCIFCSSCSNLDKKRRIDFETFKKTIDYLMLIGGIEEISLSGGEPFLHPDIFKMVKYCKSYGIRTVIFTSGIKLHTRMTSEEKLLLENNLRKEYSSYLKEGMPIQEYENLIQKLMKRYIQVDNRDFTFLSTEDFIILEQLGLDKIVFDFQAWNRKKYNIMMGTTDSFDLFTTSLAKSSKYNFYKDAHFIPTKQNYKELPDIIEILNYCRFDSLSLLNFVPQGRGKLNQELLLMGTKEYEEFKEIYNKQKEIFNGVIRVGIPLLSDNTHKCTAGFSKMVIKYDGTVLPCPAFKEYDKKVLESLGFPTPNIYENLESIRIRTGNMTTPLCKKLYNFKNAIK